MTNYYVVTVVFAGLVSCAGAVNYKRWLPNTNFENPDNWNNGRLPCRYDRVLFPEEAPPVFVQINATLVEIVLPLNGELLLGDHASISFPLSPNNDADCRGEDVVFNRTSPKDWFDPENWCIAEDNNGTCLDPQPPSLTPDQIPTRYDDVVFPIDSSFFVDLGSGLDIFVSSLSLGDVRHTTESFQSLLNSEEGKKQFVTGTWPNVTTVTVGNDACDDVSGCATGNDEGQVFESVCNIQRTRCLDLTCPNPILPVGACCAICGGTLLLDYWRKFHLDILEKLIESKYDKTEDTVDVFVSKTSEGQIQVVFRDTTGGKDTLALRHVNELKDLLQMDMRDEGRYGVIGIELQTSGGSGTAGGHRRGRSITPSSIAGIVLSILGLLSLVALGLYCLIDRDQCRRSFTFLRFGKEEEGDRCDLEMDEGQSISFRDLVAYGYGNEMQGFGNPIYDAPVQTDITQLPDVADMCDLGDATFVRSTDPAEGFTNPLYGEEIQDLPAGSMLKLNPMYSEEGIEEDSRI